MTSTSKRRNKACRLGSKAQRTYEKRLARWTRDISSGTLLSHTDQLLSKTLAQTPGATWTTRDDLSCTFYRWTEEGLVMRPSPGPDDVILVVENLGRGARPYSHMWYLKVLIGEELGKMAIPFYFTDRLVTYLRIPENFFDILTPTTNSNNKPR